MRNRSGLHARGRGWQHEIGDVVHHERGQQQPRRRRERLLRQAAPRIGLKLPRNAGPARATGAPPAEEPSHPVTGHLQRLRMLQHRRAVGTGHTVDTQLGDPLTGHRRIDQGPGGSCQRRACLIGRRESPRRIEPEHHSRLLRIGALGHKSPNDESPEPQERKSHAAAMLAASVSRRARPVNVFPPGNHDRDPGKLCIQIQQIKAPKGEVSGLLAISHKWRRRDVLTIRARNRPCTPGLRRDPELPRFVWHVTDFRCVTEALACGA